MKKAKLVVTNGDETRYLPVLDGVTIGRAPQNDVVLSGRGVKDVHCSLGWAGQHLMLRLSDPTATVLVNGEPSEDRELHSDDVIGIGKAALKVQIDGDNAVSTVDPSPDERGRAARFTLEAIDPATGPTMRAFRDAVRIAESSVLLLVGNLENGIVTNPLLRVVHEAMRYRAGRDQGPAEVLRTLNREFCDRKIEGTAVAAKVVFADGTLTCASAGHTGPLLVRSSETQAVNAPASVGLGVLRNADFKVVSIQTMAGEIVLLGSAELHPGLQRIRGASGGYIGTALRRMGEGAALALHV